MMKLKISQVAEVNPSKTVDLSGDTEISFLPMENVSVDGHIKLDKTIPVSRIKNYAG